MSHNLTAVWMSLTLGSTFRTCHFFINSVSMVRLAARRRLTCAGTCVQVLFKVFSGLKPEVPGDMPADYRALMEECWATDPVERPSFRAILPRLRSMLAAARAAAAAPAAAAEAGLPAP